VSAKVITSTAAWSDPITLTEGELWFVRTGAISITLGNATPDEEDGIPLVEGDYIKLEAGEVVRHRAGRPGACTFAREPKA
jgi:hypothetical protein